MLGEQVSNAATAMLLNTFRMDLSKQFPSVGRRHRHPASGIFRTPFPWKAFRKHPPDSRDRGCGGRSFPAHKMLRRNRHNPMTAQCHKRHKAVRSTTGTWIKSYGHRATDSLKRQQTPAHGPNLPVSAWMAYEPTEVCIFSNY